LSAAQLQHTLKKNHAMANGLQRLCFKKGSIRRHLDEGFSNARASFLPGILNKYESGIRTGDNNGILGSLSTDSPIGLLIINLTQ
jgi:hypothetical protein